MLIEILSSRGGQAFIIRYNKEYYLVNVPNGTCTKARPPDRPDMFLKYGYFEDANVDASTKAKIESIFLKAI
jgi:hypothetical protein